MSERAASGQPSGLADCSLPENLAVVDNTGQQHTMVSESITFHLALYFIRCLYLSCVVVLPSQSHGYDVTSALFCLMRKQQDRH